MSSYGYYPYGLKWPTGAQCPGCTYPLHLVGYDWKDSYTTARFAIDVVCLVAFLALAVFACLPRAKTGRLLFLAAVISSIM